MKENKQKQQAGLWLDNNRAFIITRTEESGDYNVSEKIKSDNEGFVSGSEHTRNNAKQGDLLKYFKQVSNNLVNYDELYVFGTGKSQEQFQNFLKEDAQFSHKKITIDSSDHIEEPQMINKVKEFFNN